MVHSFQPQNIYLLTSITTWPRTSTRSHVVVAAKMARDHPGEVLGTWCLGTSHGQEPSCSPSHAHFPPVIDEGKGTAGWAVVAPKACMEM